MPHLATVRQSCTKYDTFGAAKDLRADIAKNSKVHGINALDVDKTDDTFKVHRTLVLDPT